MTVTIVYGNTADGYLHNYDASYANARTGPADGVTAGSSNTNYYGQNNNGGSFANFQGFIGFNYSAIPATDMVTAAAIALYQNVQLSTSVARDMEIRGYAWSSGGLVVGDWRTPAQLSAARLDAVVKNVQGSVNKMTQAGSDEFLTAMSTVTAMEEVVVSSRQRAGSQPTADEGSAFYSADASGTANDPTMIFTTFPRTHFTPHLGAVATLSDGSMVHLMSGGEAVPTALGMWRVPLAGGGASSIGTVGTTTNTYDVAPAKGNQGVTVCVDSADNIYVVGKRGSSENELWVKCWAKNPGVWTWTPGSARIIALPTYDTAINNVSACWHPANNGTLMIVAGHTTGAGVSGGTGNELAWALVDSTYVRTGTGTLIRATGSLLGSILAATTSAEFNTHGNEVGTGLEVTADAVQPNWGYVLSFKKGQLLGENADLDLGRYVLNAAGNGFAHTSYQASVGWGRKDAAGKVRLLAVGDGQVVSVTADDDSGWGLTAVAWQAQGTSSGLVELGGGPIGFEDIASMPDGDVIAPTSWWDAIYNSAENSVWIYYRHASTPGKLMRTSLDLNSYNFTRLEVQVIDVSPKAITGVRVGRNAVATQKAVVGIATLDGSTLGHQELVDAFNLAPTAPVLTPRANYDGAAAATFAWTFGDPNPGDTQSAYELEVERTDTGVNVLDTGKVTSTTSSRNVTGGTLANNLSYRWRVRTWDAQDAVSPWSSWGTFSTSAGGTVTITDPAVDNPDAVVTDEVQVSWSVAGTTQASYRVILKRNDTAATVSDTNWITSTATSYLVTGMVSGVEHTIQVQVRNAALVTSGIGSRLITPNYGTPEVPLLTVQPVPEEGYVLVTVDNPISGQPDLGTTALDMESGSTAGWTPFSVTLADDTTQAHGGTHSLKLTSTGTPTQAYARYGSPPAPIVPTERYTARMWVYSPVARNVGAALDWAGPGWAYLSTSALDTAVAANTWTEIQVTGTAPAGADRVSFGPTLGGNPAAGSILYVDDVILVAASDRPAVVRNRILRRKAGSGDPWEVVGTTTPDGSFRDYTAPGRVPVEYIARGESA